MSVTPRVADISHHNEVDDLEATAKAGIWGIIHKATQGSSYHDPDYPRRRKLANDAGMNWGAYHFNDGSPVESQVRNFIEYARPDDGTLMVLDFEDNHGPGGNMSIHDAVKFLKLMEQRGYKCAIYSGNRVKEHLRELSQEDRAYMGSHLLWLCQYGPRAVLPVAWNEYFLWQYTGDGIGQQPHEVPGIRSGNRGLDLNIFNGTREELDAKWSSFVGSNVAASDPDPEPRSTHSAHAELDGADDNSSTNLKLPPFLTKRSERTVDGHPVRPQTAHYSLECELIQRKLTDMGYPTGGIDGKWGGLTAGSVASFYNDRGIRAIPELDQQLVDAVSDAVSDGFKRPLAPERADAKPEDIKNKSEAVRLNLWQRFWAKVGVGAAGLGFTGSSITSLFQTAQDKLQTVEQYFASVPAPVWFLLALIIAGAVWYAATRAANATTSDFKVGRLK